MSSDNISQQGPTALQLMPQPMFPLKGFAYEIETSSDLYAGFEYLPKISFITPSYNQGVFLEETIRSILAQNYPNVELIVMDGGSKDESVAVLELYAPFLTRWVSEKDKGTYDANNKGLKLMTGDYWCVLNSDDTLLDGCIYEIIKVLNQPGTKEEWITGGIALYDDKSNIKGDIIPQQPKPIGGYTFAHSCWIFHASTFLSKKVYDVIGGFVSSDIMDFDYWIAMECFGYKPYLINKPLTTLRFHSNSKGYNQLMMIRGVRDRIQRLRDELFSELRYNQIKEFNDRLAEWDLYYLQMLAKDSLYKGERGTSFGAMMRIASKFPKQLTKRWYWGLVRRFFTGIKEKEYSVLQFLNE